MSINLPSATCWFHGSFSKLSLAEIKLGNLVNDPDGATDRKELATAKGAGLIKVGVKTDRS